MINSPLPRLDKDERLRELLLPYCRLKRNEIWSDPQGKHIVGCLDSAEYPELKMTFGKRKASLVVQDPPYNMIAFGKKDVSDFITWSKIWIKNSIKMMKKDSSLYIWLGADQKNHFQPFAEFILR